MTVEEHYRALAPKLTRYLVASGSDYATACDVVQETFLRVWNMREDLSDDSVQVSGLVYTIARNLRMDHLRRGARLTFQDEIRDEDAGAVDTARTADAAMDAAYLRRRLNAAFAELPPLLREAYLLFQVSELSIREIARLTNVSESLVKVRIFRAKEKLRPRLADLL